MKRILVFRRGLLGDNLVASPALWCLRQAYPTAHIVLVSEQPHNGSPPWGRMVFQKSGLVDEVVGYGGYNARSLWVKSKWTLSILRQIGRGGWDLGIALDVKEKINWEPLLLRMARVKEIVLPGQEHSINNAKATGNHRARHISEILVSVLSSSEIPIPKNQAMMTSIGIRPEEEAEADAVLRRLNPQLHPKPWIAVGPWSNMSAKQWPMERFISVLSRIREVASGTPLLFGGNENREDGANVIRRLGFGVSFAGSAPVRHAVAIMRHCDFFLGCDTGTMHMAVSAGLKCVAIFSARDIPGLWHPYGEGHEVLRKSVPCEGCMTRVCPKSNSRCVDMIGTEHVVSACFSFLSKGNSW